MCLDAVVKDSGPYIQRLSIATYFCSSYLFLLLLCQFASAMLFGCYNFAMYLKTWGISHFAVAVME